MKSPQDLQEKVLQLVATGAQIPPSGCIFLLMIVDGMNNQKQDCLPIKCSMCDRLMPGATAATHERPRHYTAKRGSDADGKANDNKVIRQISGITAGLCVPGEAAQDGGRWYLIGGANRMVHNHRLQNYPKLTTVTSG